MNPTPPPGLSDTARRSLERTRLSYERTLMSWLRTALSLISFGFVIYKFFQYLQEAEQLPLPVSAFGPREFGLLMISSGLVALVLATIDHRNNLRKLRTYYGPLPYSHVAMLAGLIGLLGILGLLAVVFRQ